MIAKLTAAVRRLLSQKKDLPEDTWMREYARVDREAERNFKI